MKIGIDISQTAYQGTGVGNYVKNLTEQLIRIDDGNEYVLFYSSLRRKYPMSNVQYPISKVKVKIFSIPPTVLDFLWNRLHIFPIEWFVGDVDVFISSDWTQPPVRNAKNVTILYDLIILKHPEETAKEIIEVQKRKLAWVQKECDMVLCISEATKKDAMELLHIPENKLSVTYPGV